MRCGWTLNRGLGERIRTAPTDSHNGLKSVALGLPESEHAVNTAWEFGMGPAVQVKTCVDRILARPT